MRNSKAIQYLLNEAKKKGIHVDEDEEKKDKKVSEKNKSDSKKAPEMPEEKVDTGNGKKITLPKIPTAAELLGKDPSELNPPSGDTTQDLDQLDDPPEFKAIAKEPSPEDQPPEEPPADVPPEELPQDDKGDEGDANDEETPDQGDPSQSPDMVVPRGSLKTPQPNDELSEQPPDDNPEDPNQPKQQIPQQPEQPEEDPEIEPDPTTGQLPPGDMSVGANGMPGDPNMPGMGMMPEEEPLEPEDLGKIYIMKKIYSRLLALDKNLNYFNDPEFDDLKKHNSEALELFEMIVSNFDQFKDKLDDIVKLFQKLMVNMVRATEKLSKKVRDGDQ